LTSLAQAQEPDSRWRRRITDTNNKVKVEATIRFLADAIGSFVASDLAASQTAMPGSMAGFGFKCTLQRPRPPEADLGAKQTDIGDME
jgi:hypothetical protein